MHSSFLFLFALAFFKCLNIKVLFCELRPSIRELVTTDTCEIQGKVKLNAALKASIDATYAAGLLVAALLLSTYLLNDRPMC